MRPATLPFLAALAALLPPLAAAAQSASRPQAHALRNVRLSHEADAPQQTLLLSNGRIERILDAAAEPPAHARVIDGQGMLALPAFLDAYTHAGCATPTPVADKDVPPKAGADVLVDMREANRKGIQPGFRSADAFKLEPDAGKRYRESGFGALLSAPNGQFLSGSSALATTRDAAPRDVVVRSAAFDHGGFQGSGPGYPGTVMGAMAQLRQFLLDAQRSREMARRRAEGRPGVRPPYDADLEAIQPALSGGRRIVCEAESANAIERWIGLGDEFGFETGISGGREAWRRAQLLAEKDVPVLLTLDWGEEVPDPHAKDKKPDAGTEDSTGEGRRPGRRGLGRRQPPETSGREQDPVQEPEAGTQEKQEEPGKAAEEKPKEPGWTYEEPLRAREDKRRRWEEGRDCALRLDEAGVRFAFGTGKSSPKELLERVRTLVEKGLPRERALAALTADAAELLGVGKEMGRVREGFDATLALWTKDPLTAKDAKVAWLFVEGHPYEFEVKPEEAAKGKPAEGVDASGTWEIEFDDPQAPPATAELSITKEGAVTGTVRYRSPGDDSERTGEFEGSLDGAKLRLSGKVRLGNFEAEVVLEGEIEKDAMKGTTTWKFPGGEDTRAFKAARKPKQGGS